MIWREGQGRRPWRARHRLRGRQVQRSFETKKLADDWLREERRTYSRELAGLPVQLEPITYEDLCQLFLDNYTARSKPWVEEMLAYSRNRFGSTLVHLLRSEHIGKWLHSELDLSPKTKQHILGRMRQVLTAAVEWNYITRSPARPGAVKPPPQRPPLVLPLESWDDVLKVADAAGHYGPLIRFVCATGLRGGEWSNLEWGDIDKDVGVMNVRGTKTDSSRRAVVLPKPALSALEDVVRRLDTPLVFTTTEGKKINPKVWGKHAWKNALAGAGLAHRPGRQLRHTYATLALAQGCTLEWISGQMGHSSIEITRKHYARFVKRVDDRMRALLDQMEEVDGPVHNRSPVDTTR